jgi:D-sedoheptulose 7-phosphate isomerase
MNELDRIFSKSVSEESFANAYIKYLTIILSKVDTKEISNFINILLDARNRDATIFFMGNGGSAATASHFANDIGVGVNVHKNNPFRVISLVDNCAVITAISNDDGYENVFSKQLQVLMKKGDVVVAISASGNSKNLLEAFKYAEQNGGITFGITAFDGGELKKNANHGIHITTGTKEYGPAEDVHMIINHLVSVYLIRLINEK